MHTLPQPQRKKLSHRQLAKIIQGKGEVNHRLAGIIKHQDGIQRAVARAVNARIIDLDAIKLLLPREEKTVTLLKFVLDLISGAVAPPTLLRPCHCCEEEVDVTNTQLPEETATGGCIICVGCSPIIEAAIESWTAAAAIQRRACNKAYSLNISEDETECRKDIVNLSRDDLDNLTTALTITPA